MLSTSALKFSLRRYAAASQYVSMEVLQPPKDPDDPKAGPYYFLSFHSLT